MYHSCNRRGKPPMIPPAECSDTLLWAGCRVRSRCPVARAAFRPFLVEQVRGGHEIEPDAADGRRSVVRARRPGDRRLKAVAEVSGRGAESGTDRSAVEIISPGRRLLTQSGSREGHRSSGGRRGTTGALEMCRKMARRQVFLHPQGPPCESHCIANPVIVPSRAQSARILEPSLNRGLGWASRRVALKGRFHRRSTTT